MAWSSALLIFLLPFVAHSQDNLERCSFPPDSGLCEAAMPRFYYDRVRSRCVDFTYGGCGGNENNFESLDACQTTCRGVPPCPIASMIRPPPGCKYLEGRGDDGCPRFNLVCTGGLCGSNPCSSDPCELCINTPGQGKGYECRKQPRCGPINDCSRMRCSSGHVCKVVGDQGRCLELEAAQPPKQCLQPKMPGPCRGSFPRWFYDSTSKQCEQFIYGGCQGNENRFETRGWCSRVCIENRNCLIPPIAAPPEGCRYNTKHDKEGCPVYELVCEKPGQCPRLPPGTRGICVESCSGDQDCKDDDKCCSNGCGHTCQRPQRPCPLYKLTAPPEGCEYKEIIRDGCPEPTLVCTGGACASQACASVCQLCINTPGQGSGFECRATPDCDPSVCAATLCLVGHQCKVVGGQGLCLAIATNSDPPAQCLLPKETGLCKAYMPQFFYNSSAHECQRFIYGGCQGNANRFRTPQACNSVCNGQQGACAENPCRKCETCIPEPKVCKRAPCPQHRCQKNDECNDELDVCAGNPCGSCQRCVPEPKNCLLPPCPQYRCQDLCDGDKCERCVNGKCKSARRRRNCRRYRRINPCRSRTCPAFPEAQCERHPCDCLRARFLAPDGSDVTRRCFRRG